jgi:hypothetical protein
MHEDEGQLSGQLASYCAQHQFYLNTNKDKMERKEVCFTLQYFTQVV